MIPTLPFGRTGHLSTRTLFGAAAFDHATPAEVDRTLDVLLSYGVNHIDTAASYGASERLIGPWMGRHRQDFFLATKVEQRTYGLAWDSIRRSLDLLRVDHVDLLQLHNVSDPGDWEQVLGPGGAAAAVLEAQAQGLTRFIGITGHGVGIARLHKAALERVDFDSVLLPCNYPLMQNPAYATDFEALMSVCRQRNVAVQAIKTLTRRPWGSQTPTRTTWYEPIEDQTDIDRAVDWVFARPELFLNTPGDVNLLPKVLDAASRYQSDRPAAEVAIMATRLGMEPLFT